ncbi:MAG: IS1595 family transposase [Paracoccaceae bacterium]|nr:IS1595 family transposase [Paracoccaceae bacterium]MDE2917072.1 IS1595 family transposase [Paracoccaceae bacterium]
MVKAPGQNERTGLSLLQLVNRFPNDKAAEKWLEDVRWKEKGKHCPRCGSFSISVRESRKPMPYHCKDCRKYFSVKTGTVMESSKIPLRKWVIALYLQLTNLKGVSSMKIHRDLDMTQKSAWFMGHRIRMAFDKTVMELKGIVEVDETYTGGLEGNKHESKKLKQGRGGVGKSIIAGMKDRETKQVKMEVIPDTKKETLQGFVNENIEEGTQVYTDENLSYKGLDNHESVNHSAGKYVVGSVHTNGIESLWAMFKRGHKGTYHKMSKKHLGRYTKEFEGRHNMRVLDTEEQMTEMVASMVGKRLMYKDLIEDNNLDSGSRPTS